MSAEFKRFLLITPLVLLTLTGLAACAPAASAPRPTTAPANAPTAAPTPAPVASPTATPTSLPLPTPIDKLMLSVSSDAKLGNILTDAQGMTLYYYQKDTPDTSTCTDSCATTWPPLTIPQGITPTANPGILGNIGVLERGDNTYQITFNDMPLYHYAGDKQQGDTNGNGRQNLWSVIVVPPKLDEPATPAAGTVDWARHGFPTILASQTLSPGKAATITAGPYTIFVPDNAFTAPVTFTVLSGDPASFQAKAPHGQTPLLAFALSVRDAKTNALIDRFAQPVILTARDSRIVGDSGYYAMDVNGAYTLNPAGIQVQAGELTHPLAATSAGWVITAPVPGSPGN